MWPIIINKEDNRLAWEIYLKCVDYILSSSVVFIGLFSSTIQYMLKWNDWLYYKLKNNWISRHWLGLPVGQCLPIFSLLWLVKSRPNAVIFIPLFLQSDRSESLTVTYTVDTLKLDMLGVHLTSQMNVQHIVPWSDTEHSVSGIKNVNDKQ